MASGLSQNRETFLLAAAALVAVAPLLIGYFRGQVPKQILGSFGIPLAGGTFLLALGLRLIARHLDKDAQLFVSIFFGAIWLLTGAHARYIASRYTPDLTAPAFRMVRTLGTVLMTFGAVWIAASLLRYYRT